MDCLFIFHRKNKKTIRPIFSEFLNWFCQNNTKEASLTCVFLHLFYYLSSDFGTAQLAELTAAKEKALALLEQRLTASEAERATQVNAAGDTYIASC